MFHCAFSSSLVIICLYLIMRHGVKELLKKKTQYMTCMVSLAHCHHVDMDVICVMDFYYQCYILIFLFFILPYAANV